MKRLAASLVDYGRYAASGIYLTVNDPCPLFLMR
jgi:hypothetical protein